MASVGIQMLASVLCLAGWAGIIFATVLPLWRVTAFMGSTIVTTQTFWEGIWMTCVAESTGHIQCKPYYSMLALTTDLQAARALMAMAIATGGVGLILAFIGGKCTRFLDDKGPETKRKVAIAAGAVLIATGLLCLIPTSWAAGVVVQKFYSAAIDAERRELGGCLYIGWGAAVLLILGGGLFISSSLPPESYDAEKNPSVRYLAVRSSNDGSQAGSHYRLPSVQNHPVRAISRAQSYEQPTSKFNGRPRMEDDEPIAGESERSWASTTKSQMKRPGSVKSELSEASTTKSQLKRAELEEVTDLAESDNEVTSVNPDKTYL